MSSDSPKLQRDKVHLGITCTLWWNDDFPRIDIGIPFEQCVSEMALAGFEGCSIGHKFPTDPNALKQALQLRNLAVSEPWVSTYFTIEGMKAQTIETVRKQLAFMEELERDRPPDDTRRADLVVAELGWAVHPLPVALYPNAPTFTEQQWKLLIDGLHEIGQIARNQGRLLCYHPHLGTGVMRGAAVERLFNETDPELVHMLLDTAHLVAGGADLLAITQKFAHRIKHVHLKDLRDEVVTRVHNEGLSFEQGIEAGIFTVPGDGSIKILPEILGILRKANFSGWLTIESEQDPAKANPLTYAKLAYAFLREHLEWAL